MANRLKIRKLDCLPILHTHKDKVLVSRRIDEEDKWIYNFEIRDTKSFKVLFKDTIITDIYLTLFYNERYVIFCGYGSDKYVVDLDELRTEKIVSKHPFYSLFIDHFIGMDLDTKDYILMNSDLQVVRRKALSSVFRIKSALVQNLEISDEESEISIIDPLSFKILWRRDYKGTVLIKNSTNTLLFILVREPGKDTFQIIETHSGIVKYETRKSVANVVIDEMKDLAYIGNWAGITIIGLKEFNLIRSFPYPRTSKVTGMIGISHIGIMYSGNMRENFFGLMDGKTGKKLWEYDYIPEGADTLNITNWISLKNGRQILGCYIPKKSAVIEFEP